MSTEPDYGQTEAAVLGAAGDAFDEAPDFTNPIRELVAEHFGCDPDELAVAVDHYLPIVEVHLHRAVEKFVDEPGRRSTLHGASLPLAWPRQYVPFSTLVSPPTLAWPGPTMSSPEYVQQEISTGRASVLRRGLYLVDDPEGPLALWVSFEGFGRVVDVVARDEDRARAVIDELRQLSYELNPFQGQVITITIDCPGNVIPVYLERPRDVSADEVVLPGDLLARIEQQALGLSAAGSAMRRAGHSLKRGILLYGRPGTGKTHTIRYLISQMPEHTVLLMPAGKMEMFTERLAEIVPYITPGIMIFDDVDLIAEDREQWFNNPNRGPLFSLLELMDGIGADADLLFILTTNVVDRLEEAIVARPGRVDQAFEIPPPDDECRRRLIETYAKDLGSSFGDLDGLVARTDGVTGSFLKEFVRRAAVVAALADPESDDIVVGDEHAHTALDQLLDPSNEMTARLLGAETVAPRPSLARVSAELQKR